MRVRPSSGSIWSASASSTSSTQLRGSRAGAWRSTGREVAQAGVVQRLIDHGRRRGAVAFLFALAPEHLTDVHGAHVFIAVGDLGDAPRDQAGVVEHLGRLVAMRSLHDDVARQRPESRPDGVDHLPAAVDKGATRVPAEGRREMRTFSSCQRPAAAATYLPLLSLMMRRCVA